MLITGCSKIPDRLRFDKTGAAMVEFAFIAVPFLILILGMLQTILAFVAKASLDSNLQVIAYDFSNAGADTASSMLTRETLCTRNLFILVDCGSPRDLCFAIFPVDGMSADQMSPLPCIENATPFNVAQGTFALVSEYEIPPYLDLFVLLKNLISVQSEPRKIRSVAFALRR